MKLKKIVALLLSMTMVFSLAACSSTSENTGSETETTTDTTSTTTTDQSTEAKSTTETTTQTANTDLQNVMIGVAVSDPTNSEVIQLVDYLDYLSENMPVTFKVSEAIENSEQEIAFIEECATSGCKGIIGQYTDNAATAIAKCAEYEMYYTGSSENEEIYNANKDNPFYLGGITYGNGDYDALYEMGKYLAAQGSKKIVYANGGADFGVAMFVNRQNGFKAAIEEAGLTYDDSVITVSGFPGDAFFAAQTAALSEDIDAVCASFNGVDYWVTPMASAGLTGKVPLASYGSINETYVNAMKDGSLSVLAAVNVQKYGLQVALIFNAVNGDANALKEDGTSAVNKAVGVWLLTDAKDAETLYQIQESQKIYTAEDLLSLCTAVNPSANSQTLQDLIDKGSIEKLLGTSKN